VEADYYEGLSEDSKRSLTLQGGVFGRDETRDFLARPHAADAMRVRRWDDAAKVAGEETPPLAHFLEIAARCT
jgi:predicted HD phosphohydrolase